MSFTSQSLCRAFLRQRRLHSAPWARTLSFFLAVSGACVLQDRPTKAVVHHLPSVPVCPRAAPLLLQRRLLPGTRGPVGEHVHLHPRGLRGRHAHGGRVAADAEEGARGRLPLEGLLPHPLCVSAPPSTPFPLSCKPLSSLSTRPSAHACSPARATAHHCVPHCCGRAERLQCCGCACLHECWPSPESPFLVACPVPFHTRTPYVLYM